MLEIVYASLVVGGSPLLLLLLYRATATLVAVVLGLLDRPGSKIETETIPQQHRPKAIDRSIVEANVRSATNP